MFRSGGGAVFPVDAQVSDTKALCSRRAGFYGIMKAVPSVVEKVQKSATKDENGVAAAHEWVYP